MNKKRIILFAPTLHTGGGTERVLVNLANNLMSRFYSVIIVVNFKGRNEVYEINSSIVAQVFWWGKIRIKNRDNILVKIINKVLGGFFINSSLKYLIKTSEDIIISFSNTITLELWRSKYKKQIVAFEHLPYWKTTENPKIRKKVLKIFPLLRMVIVLTNSEKNRYENIGCRDVIVIPNAYTYWPNQQAQLINKNVLCIGHFNLQKRKDLLLRAWAKISPLFPDWKLIMVGDGELLNDALEIIKKLYLEKTVEIVKPTRNVAKYYYEASIFVLSSEYEALPMVLIEAKTFGVPCVSFDIESGPIDIIVDGQDGYLACFPNIDDLADKLLRLIEDESKRQEFGKNARNDSFIRFSPEKIYDLWDKVLIGRIL